MAWMAPRAAQQSFSDVDDDPDAHQVVDLVELLAPHHHLLVDAPQVLGPPGHLGLDARGGQPLAHRHQHPGQVLVALGGPGGHHLLDLGVALGVQGGEGQVLELPLDLLDPEAVGQRGVDVEGLLGRAALLPLGHDGQGPHVVEPVGQLDQRAPASRWPWPRASCGWWPPAGPPWSRTAAGRAWSPRRRPRPPPGRTPRRSPRGSARCPPRRRGAGRRPPSGRRGPARPRWRPRPPGG